MTDQTRHRLTEATQVSIADWLKVAVLFFSRTSTVSTSSVAARASPITRPRFLRAPPASGSARGRGVAHAIEQVGFGQGFAVFDQATGDVRLIDDQKTHQTVGHIAERA